MSSEKNRFKLSILFFFQFCVMGGVVPVLSLYLRELPGFSGFRVGFVLSMTSIAAVTSPLIAQRIADRYISSEKLYSFLHVICGFLIILFRQQTGFALVALLYLFLMICLSPTSTLLNVFVFHSLGENKTKYGFLRVWGTLGWIFMAVFFSCIWLGSDILPFKKEIGDVYYVTAFFCFFTGFYSMTMAAGNRGKNRLSKRAGIRLKDTLPEGDERKELFYFVAISVLASAADKTYFLGISPFLKYSGFAERAIMPSISIGMVPEVAAMFILYRLISKKGYKNILSLGIAAHIIRFALFIAASETGLICLVFPGIFLHGFTFAFFTAVSYIFLDTFCSDETRSSLHLIYAFIVAGTGNLSGNLIGGVLMDLSLAFRGNYTLFWIFPSLVSLSALVLLRKKISSR